MKTSLDVLRSPLDLQINHDNMKAVLFRNMRMLLKAMGFRVRSKDILLLENWRSEFVKNKRFNNGINTSLKDEVPVKKLAPVKRMREFSDSSGIKIADED